MDIFQRGDDSLCFFLVYRLPLLFLYLHAVKTNKGKFYQRLGKCFDEMTKQNKRVSFYTLKQRRT